MPDPNPWPGWTGRFLIEVDGQEIGTFNEVSGLSVQVQIESIPEGGENGFVHKVPGRMDWPNLVLKRGLTKGDNLFKWFEKSSGSGFAAGKSKLERSTAAVTLLDQAGKRIRSWSVTDAFPVKWSGPSFSAGASDLAVEELEITHHGFTAETK